MRSHRKPRKSLTEAGTYQEAVQILNSRKAPGIFAKTVDMIFKVDTSQPTGRTYQKQMLQETENDLKKVEEQGLMGHQMNETDPDEDDEKKFSETEGNPSSGKENVTENSIADKSGTSAQSDGSSVEEQIDKTESSEEGSKPAQSQQGISQLKETINQVADMGNVDPMNKAVIDYMANGMSQVEAQSAAAMDNNLMEAVFKKNLAKVLPKVLNPFVNEIARLQETIRVQDKKMELMRKTNPASQTGYQETVMIKASPGSETKVTNRFAEQTPEEIRSTISEKYIDMG